MTYCLGINCIYNGKVQPLGLACRKQNSIFDTIHPTEQVEYYRSRTLDKIYEDCGSTLNREYLSVNETGILLLFLLFSSPDLYLPVALHKYIYIYNYAPFK